MTDANTSSAEQLDALLEAGKISQEEYDTLRAAMETKAAEQAQSAGRSRLTRSRADRIIGGVCGGLADYYDFNPTSMRIVFVLGFVFTSGLIVFAYLALWLLLPWDATEDVARRADRAFPWGFAVAVFVLWVAHFVFLIKFLPRFVSTYVEVGAILPPFSLLVIRFGNLCQASLFFDLLQLILLGGVIGFCAILPARSPVRLAIEWIVVLAFVALTVVYAVAVIVPLRSMG